VDHVAPIVLALVMLCGIEVGESPAGSGDGESDLDQQTPVMPAQAFRAQDRRTRSLLCGFDESFERVGIRC